MDWNQLRIDNRYGFTRPLVLIPANDGVPEHWSISTRSETTNPETAAAGFTLISKRQTIRGSNKSSREVSGRVWTINGTPLSPMMGWTPDDWISGHWEVVQEEKERLVRQQQEREEQTRLRDVAIAEIHKALVVLGIDSRKHNYGIEISWDSDNGGHSMDNLDKLLGVVQHVVGHLVEADAVGP